MENKIKCPKCGSDQLHAEKKGFSAGKAAAGAVLTGGIGILAGGIGSGKIKITCLKCGHSFKPGADMDSVTERKKEEENISWTPILLIVFLIIVLYYSC